MFIWDSVRRRMWCTRWLPETISGRLPGSITETDDITAIWCGRIRRWRMGLFCRRWSLSFRTGILPQCAVMTRKGLALPTAGCPPAKTVPPAMCSPNRWTGITAACSLRRAQGWRLCGPKHRMPPSRRRSVSFTGWMPIRTGIFLKAAGPKCRSVSGKALPLTGAIRWIRSRSITIHWIRVRIFTAILLWYTERMRNWYARRPTVFVITCLWNWSVCSRCVPMSL